MAKGPSKKKKKSDHLAILLGLLAIADKESARALKALGKALEVPAEKIRFKTCTFRLSGKPYSARLTVAQREIILDVVDQGGNVFAAAAGFLSTLNVTAAGDWSGLTAILDPGTGDSTKIVPLGCCTCSSGQMPNLTQAQCTQFPDSTWTQPPDCTGQEP
jgi:hypothetical protein